MLSKPIKLDYNHYMKTTTTMTVSMKPELLEKIRELAERENRNLSNMVTVLLEDAVKNKAA